VPDRPPGPVGDGGLGVLRLGREHQHVVDGEVDLGRISDSGQLEGAYPVRPGVAHLPHPQELELCAAGDNDHLAARSLQLGGDAHADTARADDDVVKDAIGGHNETSGANCT